MISVLFGKRALPLAWIVVAGKKGHFPQGKHVELLGQVAKLVPSGREAIFLGDGEFDGCDLLGTVQKQDWEFACRTAKNVVPLEQEEGFGGGASVGHPHVGGPPMRKTRSSCEHKCGAHRREQRRLQR